MTKQEITAIGMDFCGDFASSPKNLTNSGSYLQVKVILPAVAIQSNPMKP